MGKYCERCGGCDKYLHEGQPVVAQFVDYCAMCSKDLCAKCMANGCCGQVPAHSGQECDEVSELDDRGDLTAEQLAGHEECGKRR
mgnify:CR=1 FL=1